MRRERVNDGGDIVGSGEIVGVIDDGSATAEFVIADITRDDAWIAVPAQDAAPLEEWR